VLAMLVAALAALSVAAVAQGAESEWHSEQPVGGLGVPAPLGKVGGVAFWSPDKGVLITEGNGGMPAGVYAYDGSRWYLYSTVCGGTGDIAISGPDEFWTIANYGETQEGSEGREAGRTLCHFANGEVVASYAEPAASPEAFLPMKAAACDGPSDCWFAGSELRSPLPNLGSFHLYWNGGGLTPVPSMATVESEVSAMPGEVENLAFSSGRLFETANESPYLREVSLTDPRRFLSVEPESAVGPFVLSTEPLEEQAWAVSRAGTVLRLGVAGFETVPTEGPIQWSNGSTRAVGAEPGIEAAWIGSGGSGVGIPPAQVRRVTASGAVGPIVELPRPSEELDPKGPVEQIVCPAAEQCWMVTEKGWLFHLGGPPPEGVNGDPLMHRLITVRPRDASSRTFVSAGLPEDNSGEVEASREEPLLHEHFPHRPKKRALVVKVKQTLIHKTILQLAFTLRGKAHVQLLAKHHKQVVAKTPRLTLAKGRHRLRLRLDPKRWPTSLDFQVHPATKVAGK
jgi:hypothetical protein